MNQKKIKVLHLIETLGRGGAEGLITRALTNMDRNIFSPMVVYLFGESDMKKELDNGGIPVICLGMKSAYNCWRALLNLYSIMKREKFDIVHTHLFFANLYGRLAAGTAGVPIIATTLHNPDYTYEDNGRISYRIRRFIDGYSGRRYNKIFFAVSNFVKQDFQKNFGFKNIEVLYNCVDSTKFSALERPSINGKRSEFGINDDETVILNIGRLHPQKDQKGIIEAFDIIHKRIQKCKLVIIGKGSMEEELKGEVIRLGLKDNVIFLKDREDVPQIMHCCDIFVSFSAYEGFCISLVEAMASGMPIVASDIGTFREIIRDNFDGVMVKRRNIEGLSESIIALIKDRERSKFLGKNAQRRAAEMFNINDHVTNLQKFYQKLIANRLFLNEQ